MACEQTRRVNCSRIATALQYSQAPCCVTKFALRLAQGARQTGVTGIIQETWRPVPAAEKSGPLQRRKIPWRPTEHIFAEPREKACLTEEVDCATDPESVVFCLCKGCGGSRNLNDNPDMRDQAFFWLA
jgi:hypothetical protein